MSFSLLLPILALSVVTLGSCRTHRLPELPQDRDPVSPAASETRYQPPPDVLTTELSPSSEGGTPSSDDEHGGHAGHGEGDGREEPGGGGAQDRHDMQKDQGGQHDGHHGHPRDGGPS